MREDGQCGYVQLFGAFGFELLVFDVNDDVTVVVKLSFTAGLDQYRA